MDFTDAAAYFDEDPVYDAYTGTLLFYCHTTPHDDHTSSGATSRRRTMTAPDATLPPARRAVTIYGEQWIVGNSNADGFLGLQVRRSFGLKKSSGLMALLTPGQACLVSFGTLFHAHKEWYRDMQDPRTESDWDPMWNIFCPPDENVVKGSFLRQGGTIFRVRSTYPAIEDLTIAEADQFDADALQSATFTTTTVSLVSDIETPISTPASVIQTDVLKFYQFRTQAESAQQPGDRTVFVPKITITPTVGGHLTMLGATWRILAAVSEVDAWALHIRRA